MTENQSDDARDMIDRLAPVFALVALLLGITAMLAFLFPQLNFVGCVSFLGLCLAVVALVKRAYLIGGLAAAICSAMLAATVLQNGTPPRWGVMAFPPGHASHMRPGGHASKVKPPASS